MGDLTKLLGVEHPLDELNRGLAQYVRSFQPPVVGALHVTCADESEWESIDSFQRWVVAPLMPELKCGRRATFHLSTLGGRYDPGALAVAEQHYATPTAREAFKVLLVKINAHVAVAGAGAEAQFGRLRRYDTESSACGALRALLDGVDQPFVEDLRRAFSVGGTDRVATLLDPRAVDPALQSLFAAVVNAQVQARAVCEEILRHPAQSRTVYVVAAAVTLNRAGADTELLCSLRTSDGRGVALDSVHAGLGDEPARYAARFELGRLHVRDDRWPGGR